MNKKILCCGNIALDLIAKSPDIALAPVFYARLGGSVCNAAVLMRRLGLSVSMISKTGRDFLSNAMLAMLQSEGVGISDIARDENINASLAFAEIDKKGDSSYVFYTENPLYKHTKAIRLSEVIPRGTEVFHTGSIFSYDDHNHASVLKCLKQAASRDVFISYDPNWRDHRIKDNHTARRRIRKILKYVDLLKLSISDVTGITGCISQKRAMNRILDDLKGELVVTAGNKGAFYWNGIEKIFHPAFKVKIDDTIGAGDAFTAGLLYRYITLGKIRFLSEKKENLRFASAVSALICTGRGAKEGLKNLRQVKNFLSAR